MNEKVNKCRQQCFLSRHLIIRLTDVVVEPVLAQSLHIAILARISHN